MKFILLANCKVKSCYMLLLFVMGISAMQAQSTTVKGTVSGDGIPLLGVNVLVRGTNNGAVTDFDGEYELTANVGDILIFSSIGFNSKQITVGSETTIDVTLTANVSSLEQVVVIGYGSQKRSEITGSISSVKGKDLQKFASSNFQDALQGRVAGVTVLDAGGEPGEGPIIQIRGANTLGSPRAGQGARDPNFNLINPTTIGLSPLYVVDGVPFDISPNISSNDIESIEVLKDAATTAIYGTRASAGVILITTKKGKSGTRVEFSSYTGISKITSKIELANTAEAFLIHRTIHDNNTPDRRYFSILQQNKNALDFDTDWQDFVQNDNAILTNFNARISGGAKDLNYSLTVDNFKQEGVFKNSNLDRTNLRGNAGIKKGKFDVFASMNLSTGNRILNPWGLLYDAIRISPYSAPFQIGSPTVIATLGEIAPDGTAGGVATNVVSGNLARKFSADSRRKEYTMGATINMNYEISESLKLRINVGGNRTTANSTTYTPLSEVISEETGIAIPERTRQATLSLYNTVYQNFNREIILDYDEYFGDHRVALLAGASADERLWEEFRLSGDTFLSPEQRTISSAQNISRRENSILPTTGNSFFGRIKYEYDSKYFLLANIRRDGSSKFGSQNRYGTFGGVSVGWTVSNENFFRNAGFLSPISNLKLRASAGTVGNDRIRDFSFISPLRTNNNPVFGGGPVTGAARQRIGNANVKWETTEDMNFGADLEMFSGAFSVTADYYINRKKDLLLDVATVPSAGVGRSSITLNTGELENKGLELVASYRDNQGKFKWSITGTFTQNVNNVIALAGQANDRIAGGFPLLADNSVIQTPVNFIRPGFRAGAFFLIPTEGVIKTEEDLEDYRNRVTKTFNKKEDAYKLGDLKYTDTNRDGVIDDNDRIFYGNNTPDFEAGLNFTADFKNFDFSMQWYAAYGQKVFNGPKNLAYALGSHRDLAYQYSARNPNSDIPSGRQNGRRDANVSSASDLYLEDGDYIRLRNIQLGYSIPKKFLNLSGIEKFRVYVSAQNLLTITDYSGYDPEIGGDGLTTRGIDTGQQPATGQGLFGVQLSF